MSRPVHQARSVARLAAVQALYQMEISGAGVETVVREFDAHRFERDLEGQRLAEADEAFFAELLRGAVERRAKIDELIAERLAEGWRLDRLDATARAILRCGVHELTAASTPTQVAIDEYVEIAKSFFGVGPETAFVNAVLDQTARHARAP
ncbi:MAG TPA: transcription antitermination factor NusB [Caulobacteraceae bacterium]